MSKEMILKIQAAEAEAQNIRMEASEQAKEKIRHAEAAGKRLCRDAEIEAIQTNEEKIQLTRQKADELLERSRREAETQAKLLLRAGEPYVKDAVKMIIGGMMEQCQ